MPFGRLEFHALERDIEVELVPHTVAARIIRGHVGRVSASEVFYRGDRVDEESFDGECGLVSVDYSKLVSIEWTPYELPPVATTQADDGFTVALETAAGSETVRVAARLLLDAVETALAKRDAASRREQGGSASAGGESTAGGTETAQAPEAPTPSAGGNDKPPSKRERQR